MGLLDDDRGQSVQVGAVLLFGFLVVFLALYQAQVVPAQNAGVEADHSDRVRTQLMELRNAILQGAATGEGYPVTVTLGTDYPSRIAAVNPPPAVGTLETTAPKTVTISNATAVDAEARDYLDGGQLTFTTKGFVYTPDYAEYSAPRTVYGTSLLYTMAGDRVVETLGDQRIVSGNTIRLVMVTGNLSVRDSQSVTVDPTVVSGAETITVENQTDPITITVPSNVSASRWAELLPAAVDAVNASGDVKIVLPPGVYRLRLAKVTLGETTPTDPAAHYVTVGEGENASILANQSQQVAFVVRDRFNNPVTNATVTVNLGGSAGGSLVTEDGTGATVTVRTDAEGRAVVRYEAPDCVDGDQDAVLTGAAATVSGDRGTASTTVQVIDTTQGGCGGGPPGGGGGPPSQGNNAVTPPTGMGVAVTRPT